MIINNIFSEDDIYKAKPLDEKERQYLAQCGFNIPANTIIIKHNIVHNLIQMGFYTPTGRGWIRNYDLPIDTESLLVAIDSYLK